MKDAAAPRGNYLREMNAFLKLELKLSPAQPAADIAIAWLSEIGFDMFEPGSEGLIAHAPWEAVEAAELEDAIFRIQEIPDLTHLESTQERIEATNWNAQWESSYEPIDVDGKARLRAPFHEPKEGGLDLIIQPQMSFGTGHHATTWQMLRYLLNQEVAGNSILDMGCGTGALAIAAHKLGAREVVAIDVDQWSFDNAIENAELNGIQIGERFRVIHGDAQALSAMDKPFDGICANINRNILLQDWSAYNRALNPGGWVLMSGFYPSDVERLTTAAVEHGWTKEHEWERDGWACVQWRKAGR